MRQFAVYVRHFLFIHCREKTVVAMVLKIVKMWQKHGSQDN